MNNTIIIGGAGFIGSFVTQALIEHGHKVTIIDQYPPAQVPMHVTYIAGNYADHELMARTIQRGDQIIFLAYASVPKTSFDDPLADLLANLPSTLDLLNILAVKQIKKVIIVSSGGTIYGPTSKLPITEDHPTNPISPYGITKIAIEKYAGMYRHTHKLPVVIVRPANAYGPGQRPFTGQGLIATAMALMIKNKPITLYGSDVVRDYIHVKDLAQGIVSALNKGEAGEIYNIGSGKGYTNANIISMLQSITNQSKLRLKIEPKRSFDVSANVLDSTKLNRVSKWQPQITFQNGLQETYLWLKEHLA